MTAMRLSTALVAGALGSIALTLYAGRTAPPFLQVLFAGWVAAPFVLLAAARARSTRWRPRTRAVLDTVSVVAAIASVAVYGVALAVRSNPTPVFVLTPPMVAFVAAIAVGAAAAARSR
jgi:hypothetical protein